MLSKLEELKEAIQTLEGQDLEKLKKAMVLVGEGVELPVERDSGPHRVLGSKVKIVVLQRGWVVVGSYSENGHEGTLENAATIRLWGTTKGLGELALDGPQSGTKLDKAGTVRFEKLTTVLVIDVGDDQKWLKVLQ